MKKVVFLLFLVIVISSGFSDDIMPGKYLKETFTSILKVPTFDLSSTNDKIDERNERFKLEYTFLENNEFYTYHDLDLMSYLRYGYWYKYDRNWLYSVDEDIYELPDILKNIYTDNEIFNNCIYIIRSKQIFDYKEKNKVELKTDFQNGNRDMILLFYTKITDTKYIFCEYYLWPSNSYTWIMSVDTGMLTRTD